MDNNFTPLDFLQDLFFTKIKIAHWCKWSRDRHKTARGEKRKKKIRVSFIIVAKKAKKTKTKLWSTTSQTMIVCWSSYRNNEFVAALLSPQYWFKLQRPRQCGSTVNSNKFDVCLMRAIFPLKLDKWRKNYTLGTRDNFITDKSLMMPHLHFSIWTGPKIDQRPDFVEMSHVKRIAVKQPLIWELRVFFYHCLIAMSKTPKNT